MLASLIWQRYASLYTVSHEGRGKILIYLPRSTKTCKARLLLPEGSLLQNTLENFDCKEDHESSLDCSCTTNILVIGAKIISLACFSIYS